MPELAVRFAIAVRGLEIEDWGAILARYARDDTVKRANDAQLEAWRSSRPDQWVRDVTSVHDAAGSAAWLVTLGGIMRRMREATTRSELDAWARLTDVGMGAVVQTAGYLATRRFWEDERAAVGYGSFADIMPFSILFSAEVERELAQ